MEKEVEKNRKGGETGKAQTMRSSVGRMKNLGLYSKSSGKSLWSLGKVGLRSSRSDMIRCDPEQTEKEPSLQMGS